MGPLLRGLVMTVGGFMGGRQNRTVYSGVWGYLFSW